MKRGVFSLKLLISIVMIAIIGTFGFFIVKAIVKSLLKS